MGSPEAIQPLLTVWLQRRDHEPTSRDRALFV